MNWNGGRLHRHSAATNPRRSAAQRQKQNFAKAQQRNLDSANSPETLSILGNIVQVGAGKDKAKPASHDSSNSHNHDIHYLSSHAGELIPRPPTRRSNSCHASQGFDIGEYHTEQLRITREPISDNEGVRNVPSTAVKSEQRKQSKPSNRNASSKKKGKLAKDSTTEERRKRALRSLAQRASDLTLLPIKLPQKAPIDVDQFCKRRKIDEHERAQFVSQRFMVESPFTGRHKPLMDVSKDFLHTHKNIKVRIGSDLLTGCESTMNGSRTSLPFRIQRSTRSPSRSSSIMLLDTETESVVGMSHDDWDSQPHESSSGKYLSEELTGSSSFSHGYRRITGVPQHPASSTRGTYGQGTDQTGTSPSFRTQSPPYDNAQKTHSVSNVDLQHPQPKTWRRPKCIRAKSAQSTQSNVAEVGEDSPVVQQNRIIDKALWRTWLASPIHAGASDCEQHEPEKDLMQDIISPGFSLVQPRYRSYVNPQATSELNGKNPAQGTSISSGEHSFSSRRQTSNVAEASTHSSVSDVEGIKKTTVGSPLIDQQPLRSNILTSDRPDHEVQGHLQKTRQADMSQGKVHDQNEIWKKFVNGSDDEEDDFIAEFSNRIILDRRRDCQFSSDSEPGDSMEFRIGMLTPHPGRKNIIVRSISPNNDAFSTMATTKSQAEMEYDDSSSDEDFVTETTELDDERTTSTGNDSISVQGVAGTTLKSNTGPSPWSPSTGGTLSCTQTGSSPVHERKGRIMFTKPIPFDGTFRNVEGSCSSRRQTKDGRCNATKKYESWSSGDGYDEIEDFP